LSWLQLQIVTDREHAESVEDALLSAGALSVTMSDEADTPILEPGVGETPLWQDIRVLALYDADIDPSRVAQQLATELSLPIDQLTWETIADQPWERAWMDHFEPIRCGDRLWICPSWQEPPEASAVNLILDPGLAFGSGTHPDHFPLSAMARQPEP
jgi:Ribosomal protein L11 methylase